MRKILACLMLTVFAATYLTSCDDDEDVPVYPNDSFYDIVTFIGHSKGNAVFELQKDGDSEPVRLTATGFSLDTTSIKVDTRLLLGYVPKSGIAYQTDEITVTGIGSIFNDKVRSVDMTTLPDWDKNEIYLFSLWRTGKYINLFCQLTYTVNNAAFGLLADEMTLDNEYPDLYLVYEMDSSPESYNKNFYASIDISDVWNRSTCRGVTIHLNNSNLGEDTFTFSKITFTPNI